MCSGKKGRCKTIHFPTAQAFSKGRLRPAHRKVGCRQRCKAAGWFQPVHLVPSTRCTPDLSITLKRRSGWLALRWTILSKPYCGLRNAMRLHQCARLVFAWSITFGGNNSGAKMSGLFDQSFARQVPAVDGDRRNFRYRTTALNGGPDADVGHCLGRSSADP